MPRTLTSLATWSRTRQPVWVPAPRSVIEPVAAGVSENDLEMPAAFANLAAPPVFISGSARSGTTWTYDMFARHPDVHGVCESWILSQTHGITSVLTQTYWDQDAKRYWEAQLDVPVGAIQLLPYQEVIRDLRDLVAGWLVRGKEDRHRYLVAKEPIDIRATSILFPEARFVHVIRDGRNVALSMKRASETWDPTMGVGLPMSVRAEGWRRQVENVRAHRDALGGRYLEVRYEAMLADPVAAIRTLFEFSGIEHDEDLALSISRSTNLSSYDDKARTSGFRGGGQRGSWAHAFSIRDAVGFHRAAGSLLIELGYEPDRRWLRAPLSAWGRALLRSVGPARVSKAAAAAEH